MSKAAEISPPPAKRNIPPFLFAAIIIITGFVVYANSLSGEFIWDDNWLVAGNTSIRSLSGASRFFTENIFADSGTKTHFYRPIQMFTYWLDYSLWKLSVRGYHLTNVVLHILVGLELYWLAILLFDSRLLAFFATVFFVVHPIHTEVVSYISGRADSLALFFILLCFIFYVKGLHSGRLITYVFMSLSYMLAVLSRENALILPILLLLYHYAFKKRLKAAHFLFITGIACAYILARVTLLRSPVSYVPHVTTLFQRIPGLFAAIFTYIRLLFLPFGLHMEYGTRLFNFSDPRVISGIILSCLLLNYAFRKRNTNRIVFFSISWFFVALLPVSNLYPINAYMAEHWLYLPSIGFFLILANGLVSLRAPAKTRAKQSHTKEIASSSRPSVGTPRNDYAIIAIAVTLVAFYSYLTIKQNDYWKESVSFHERTLRYAQTSYRAYSGLGLAYYNMGRREEGIALFKKAIAVNPNYAYAYNNIGITCYNDGRIEEAIRLYKKAIKLNPNYADAHNNLGVAYHDSGRIEEAVDLYNKALALNPNYADAHSNLAVAYYDKRQYNLSVKHCERAIELGQRINAEFLEKLEPHRK